MVKSSFAYNIISAAYPFDAFYFDVPLRGGGMNI